VTIHKESTRANVGSWRYVVIGVAASLFPTLRRAQVEAGVNVVAACDIRVEPGRQRAAEKDRPPRADGRQGVMSRELANAITLSAYTGQPATLPLDHAAYSTWLASLKAGLGRK
jgi:hypothetical protein